MDLVLNYLKSVKVDSSEQFVVSGASIRGWAAWLIAAVDPRVIGCVPIVFDLLDWNEVNLIIKNFYKKNKN